MHVKEDKCMGNYSGLGCWRARRQVIGSNLEEVDIYAYLIQEVNMRRTLQRERLHVERLPNDVNSVGWTDVSTASNQKDRTRFFITTMFIVEVDEKCDQRWGQVECVGDGERERWGGRCLEYSCLTISTTRLRQMNDVQNIVVSPSKNCREIQLSALLTIGRHPVWSSDIHGKEKGHSADLEEMADNEPQTNSTGQANFE